MPNNLASGLYVNIIVSSNAVGVPTFKYGATIPINESFSSDFINVSGVSTVGVLSAASLQAGIITATAFVGNGSHLTGISTISANKLTGINLIFGLENIFKS